MYEWRHKESNTEIKGTSPLLVTCVSKSKKLSTILHLTSTFKGLLCKCVQNGPKNGMKE